MSGQSDGILHAAVTSPRAHPQAFRLCKCPVLPHGLPLLHAGYRSGGLQDSDTEDECWSDTGAVPQPSARPREKPLSRSQSLRVVKRKPLVREVSGQKGMRQVSCPGTSAQTSHGVPALSPTGHLTLPEGPDKEKDCAFRHGQLGKGPCPVLPHALQGSGAVWRGLLAAHWACLHQLPRLCPLGSCCWLRAMHRDDVQCTKAGCAQGSIYCLSHLCLHSAGTRTLPRSL